MTKNNLKNYLSENYMGNEQLYFQRVSMSENIKFVGKVYS